MTPPTSPKVQKVRSKLQESFSKKWLKTITWEKNITIALKAENT
jgi:hypothetical protein